MISFGSNLILYIYIPRSVLDLSSVKLLYFTVFVLTVDMHKLTQNGPNRCIFRNFLTHYLGSAMCLWQFPMYQKSTNFFLDPQLKWFSGNKLYKLTQNGPKR